MPGFGDFLEQAIARYLVKRNKDTAGATALPTAPTQLFLALHSADPGDTGANELVAGSSPGYARLAVTTDLDDSVPNAVNWNQTAADGAGWGFSNKIAFAFAQATGDWNGAAQIRYWSMWDALTGGNPWLSGGRIGPDDPTSVPPNQPTGIIVLNGNVPQFGPGMLKFSSV